MSAHSLPLDPRASSRRVEKSGRPGGLAGALPLVLFGDALLLLAALTAGSIMGTLAEAFTMLAVIAALSSTIIVWFAVQFWNDVRCQGFLVLQASWLYWYLIPMILVAWRGQVYLDGVAREFSADQLVLACTAVMAAKLVSTLVYQLMLARPIINPAGIAAWLNRRVFVLPVWPVAILFAAGMIPFVFSGGPMLSTILRSRSAEGVFPKSNFGAGASLFLFTFLLIACSLLAFYRFLLTRGTFSRVLFLLLGLAAFLVYALAIATRTVLLAAIMPMLTLYLLGSPDRWRMLKIAACLVAMWLGADVLVRTRQRGFSQSDPNEQRISRNLVDNDFYSELLYAMQVVPEQIPFSHESPVAYAAFTLVPRALWPSKPSLESEEKIIRLRMNYVYGELSGNVLPGLVGQYWEASGWLGVMMAGVWVGAGLAVLDRIIASANWHARYFGFALAWELFISFRTLALGNFLPALISIPAVLAMSRARKTPR